MSSLRFFIFIIHVTCVFTFSFEMWEITRDGQSRSFLINEDQMPYPFRSHEAYVVKLSYETPVHNIVRFIFYWLGKHSTMNMRYAAATFVAVLRRNLLLEHNSNFPIISREAEGRETDFFEFYFYRMQYVHLEQGPSRMFDLYKVKPAEKHTPAVYGLVPPVLQSLDHSSSFVLDTAEYIFKFRGFRLNKRDYIRGPESVSVTTSVISDRIARVDRRDDVEIANIDERSQKVSKEWFLEHLGGNANSLKNIPANDNLTPQQFRNQIHEKIKLLQVFRDNGKFSIVEIFVGPLNLLMISPTNCFILENHMIGRAFIYIGTEAEFEMIDYVLKKGEDFANVWNQVTIVSGERLPTVFIANFESSGPEHWV